MNPVAAVAKLDPDASPIAFNVSPPVVAMLANDEGIWAIGPRWLRTPDGAVHDFADTVAYPTITDVMLDDKDTALVEQLYFATIRQQRLAPDHERPGQRDAGGRRVEHRGTLPYSAGLGAHTRR